MNKLLKYALSSTLLMGVAFADIHIVVDPIQAPVGGDSGGGGTAIVKPGGKVSYLGGGNDGLTPLVEADGFLGLKKCEKGSKLMDGGNCEANPGRYGGKKGMGATDDSTDDSVVM